MASKPTTVLFVGGYGRSGSTIIDLLIDRVPGVTAVGEFRHLFGRALGDNELCSCGRPFRDCPFWGKVMVQAFPNGYDHEQIQQAVRTFNTMRRLWPLLHPSRMNPALQKQAEIYSESFSAAYRAVAEVTGASAIVDSSKYPLHGLFLRTMPGVKLKTMLLVRDPRAVAYSWQRHRLRPEVHWEKREMPRHNVARSAVVWSLSNWLTEQISQDTRNFRLQRYEDFVDDPVGTIQEIAGFALGKPVTINDSILKHRSRAPHTVAGNPIRIGNEHISIRSDNEWAAHMTNRNKLTVGTICGVQMRRFGYRLL